MFSAQSIWAQNIISNHEFDSSRVQTPPYCSSYTFGFLVGAGGVFDWYGAGDTSAVGGQPSGINIARFCHTCQEAWAVSPNFTEAKPGYYPFPKTFVGKGYAQVSLYKTNNYWRSRASISQKLSTSLQNGEVYVLEFYTRPFIWSSNFSKNIGAYLTADSIDYYDYNNDLIPIVEANQVVDDTSSWTHVKGIFMATGNEQFITIGNFRHDTSTVVVPSGFQSNPNYLYYGYTWTKYFVDGVALYKATDTIYKVTLPKDTTLCPNETLNLVAQLDSGFKLQDTVTTYLWSNGSTDSTLLVTTPGTYWVQTNINHRFVQSDTIVVSYFRDDYTLNLPDSVAICENDLANISAATIPQTQYYWDNGHTGQTLYDVGTGTYALEAVTPCYTLYDTVKVYQQFCDTYIYIPNSFTPDGDGTNDFFAFTGVPEPATLLIYDRWGGLVFKDTAYQNTWDGTSGGQDLPAGAYNYVIEYLYVSPKATSVTEGSSKSLTGTVRILR